MYIAEGEDSEGLQCPSRGVEGSYKTALPASALRACAEFARTVGRALAWKVIPDLLFTRGMPLIPQLSGNQANSFRLGSGGRLDLLR